jgi:CcmD family protein
VTNLNTKLGKGRSLRRIARIAAALAASLLVAAPVWAQEFVKVEPKATENIPAGKLLAAAYGFIWVAVVVYVVVLARGLARTNAEMAELRKRVEGRR